MKGRFIVFDGVDGSGKDTIIEKLKKDLDTKEVDYLTFSDPSPQVASEIRNVILNTKGLCESTRLYLYLAARSELIFKQIIPALEKGKTVICNRFIFSTIAYQGLHFTNEEIDTLHKIGKLDVVTPDLQIILLSKKSHREKELEDVMGEYCNTYRQGIIKKYLECSKTPNTELVWTDRKSVDEVYSEVKSIIF